MQSLIYTRSLLQHQSRSCNLRRQGIRAIVRERNQPIKAWVSCGAEDRRELVAVGCTIRNQVVHANGNADRCESNTDTARKKQALLTVNVNAGVRRDGNWERVGVCAVAAIWGLANDQMPDKVGEQANSQWLFGARCHVLEISNCAALARRLLPQLTYFCCSDNTHAVPKSISPCTVDAMYLLSSSTSQLYLQS